MPINKLNESSLYNIWLENSTFLKKFLRRYLCKDHDIEDIVQEVYLKAHSADFDNQKSTFSEKQSKAFLFKIAKNLAINELNKTSKLITEYIEESTTEDTNNTTASLEAEYSATENLNLYFKAIDNLPNKSKEVFILRRVHGLKQKEIAEQLNISLSSVEKHLKLSIGSCSDYLARHK